MAIFGVCEQILKTEREEIYNNSNTLIRRCRILHYGIIQMSSNVALILYYIVI